MTLYKIFRLLSVFCHILSTGIFIYALLSWLRPKNGAFAWLEGFISPILLPFRKLAWLLMEKTRFPLDLSCWFAIIAYEGLNQLLWKLYSLLRLL